MRGAGGLPLLLLLAACGGGAGVVADAGPAPDAARPGAADAAIRADARQDCPVPATFIAPPAGSASAVRSADGSITFTLDLDASATPDRFQMTLVSGRGLFIDGPTTGTFGLNGVQLNHGTCALCLLIQADVGGAEETYFATSGLVELDSVTGKLTGALTDVKLEHVSIASAPPQTSTPIPDGCVTRISSMSFDVDITGP